MTDAPNTSIYRATPRLAREYIIDVLEAGLVPMVTSSPGMGKSSIMHSVCNEFNLKMIDHRVSTSSPVDFTGLPEFYTDPDTGIRKARFTPFGDLFPVEGDALPKGKDGWMLFLDEFNSGTKMVQAATYKTLLDKMTGQMKLHERLVITAAGNLMGDRAIVNQLSTALQSRVIHIELMLSFDELLMDVMIPKQWDERVIAYLSYDNNALMDFRPDHQDKTFCCPRTWEFMSKMITDRNGRPKEVEERKTGLYAGTITSGTAAAFVQYCKIYKELIGIRQILADPNNAEIPRDAQRKWAIIAHLIGKIEDTTFEKIATYVNRMDLACRILFYRAANVRHPKLREHPVFQKSMVELAQYLNGTKKAPKQNGAKGTI